jgi:pimeloyl-ACP methyl ester carboxylesterase
MKISPRSPSRSLLREAEAVVEILRFPARAPQLARQPRGRGEPVLVLPGFGAGDLSTLPLRSYLRWLGYGVEGWGLGTNRGDVPDLIPKVTERVVGRADREGRPVRLVGWSLGGYLAREAARERPDAVERVVTLGTPVVGGPKYTAAAGFYTRHGVDLDEIEAGVEARNRVPLRVPVTAIYSRSDAVVAWEACIDSSGNDVEHVEVRSTHLGLGLSPDVYGVVARRLARKPTE